MLVDLGCSKAQSEIVVEEESRLTRVDVDEAVRVQQQDPTGGRGTNGKISNQLESAKDRAVLESAV